MLCEYRPAIYLNKYLLLHCLCVANGGIRYEFVCRFQYLLALILYFLLGQCSYDRAIAIRNSLCSWILVDVQPTLIAKTTEITLAIKSHIIAI